MREPKEIEYAFLGCIFDNPPLRIPDALKVKANSDWFSDQLCKLVWSAIDSLRKKTPLEKIKALIIIDEAIRISHRKKSPFYGQKVTPGFIDEAKRFRDAAEEGEATTIEAYAPILQEAAIGRRLDSAMECGQKEDSVPMPHECWSCRSRFSRFRRMKAQNPEWISLTCWTTC